MQDRTRWHRERVRGADVKTQCSTEADTQRRTGLDWIGLQSIAAGFNGGDLSALSVDSTADKSTHGHKL